MTVRHIVMFLVTVLFALPSLVFCFNPFFSTDGISRSHAEITQIAILRKTAEVCRDIAATEGRDFSLIIDDSLSVAKVQEACNADVNASCPISSHQFQIAIENIVLSNGLVDLTLAEAKAYHFHDETFQEGRNIITTGLASVKENVNLNNIVVARQTLGQILHVLQDFYSHSNWVELGNETPFSALIRPDQPLENLAGPDTPTCRNQDGLTEDNILSEVLQQQTLTSGYFSETSPEKPAGKCSHGGRQDLTSARDPTGGISKDDVNSSHGSLHQKAANLAVNATVELLEDIRQAVGDQKFLRFMGLSQVAVLCFVIDTTFSMSEDIAEARRVSFDIIDRRRGTPEEPVTYLLVPFNDPGFGPVLYTNDSEIFRERFNNLTASGGGDFPEPSLSALRFALTETPPSSEIFLFTDAAAKDSNLKGTISALILSTKSKVTIISTDPGVVPLTTSEAQIYSDLAITSGCSLIQSFKDELPSCLLVTKDLTQSALVTVLQIVINPGTPDPLNFTLDASMMDICIFIIGASSFNLTSPTGVSQDSSQSSGPLGSLTTAGNLHRLQLNNDSQTGTWQISVKRQSSSAVTSVKISGRSVVDINFSLVEKQGDHYFFKDTLPGPGNISLLVTVTGDNITVTKVTLFNEQTKITGSLQSLPLDSSRFLVDFTGVPSGTYVLNLTGESSLGMFHRQCPTRIRTANISVATTFSGNTIEPGSVTTIPITVSSNTTGVFTLRVTNDRNFTATFPSTVTISPEDGFTVNAVISLTAAANTRAATTQEPVTLVIEAENAAATDSNYALLRLSVSERETVATTSTTAIATTTSPVTTTAINTTPSPGTTTISMTTTDPVITIYTITTGSVNLLISNTSITIIVNRTTTNPTIPMTTTVLTINTTVITTVVNTSTPTNPITRNALTNKMYHVPCTTTSTTVRTTTTTFATTTINTTIIKHMNAAVSTNHTTEIKTGPATSNTNIIISVPVTIIVSSAASPVTITGMIVMMALIPSVVN